MTEHKLDTQVSAALDQGIRGMVEQLTAAGFETTDSGDGVSKADGLPYRHVACRIRAVDIVPEAQRLQRILGFRWAVQGSYDPYDESALLFARELEPPRCSHPPSFDWTHVHPAVRYVELGWWDMQGARQVVVHRPNPELEVRRG